jgi:2-keto-3-deoxy-L-rhamnonate aldolase RhmA
MQPEIHVNRAKRMLQAQKLVLCMGINQFRSPDIAMIAAQCGYDAIYIDLEHSPTSMETASAICVAALGFGVTPIVRAASQDAHHLALLLDSGAQGIMVPHVNTAEQAHAIVQACHYPPRGRRSVPGPGPSLAYGARPQADANKILNENVLLAAMIETGEAVSNLDSIAAVEGIDVIHFGTHDLSADIGIDGQFKHPRMLKAYDAALAAGKRHSKAVGVGGIWTDPDFQASLLAKGVRYLTLGLDVTFLMMSARAEAARARAVKLG